jgi:hypothetical protein
MSEPVVVAQGIHLMGFRLSNQNMGQLGTAVPVDLHTFEFRDVRGQRLFRLKDLVG